MGHRYFKLVRPLPFTMISYFYFLFLVTKKKGEEEEKGFLIIVKVLFMYSAPPGCGSIPCGFFFPMQRPRMVLSKKKKILFFFLVSE